MVSTTEHVVSRVVVEHVSGSLHIAAQMDNWSFLICAKMHVWMEQNALLCIAALRNIVSGFVLITAGNYASITY